MKNAISQILTDASEYFQEVVTDAIQRRKVPASPEARIYLVTLLNTYMFTDNLFQRADSNESNSSATLAEMWFKANSADVSLKRDLLKRLGDSTLYISGFFGDSLRRKLVDVDYYAEIGGSAYASLAKVAADDVHAPVYEEYSSRFLDFVEVLTYISQKTLVQTNEDLLRLYERYVATGSELAREQLLEKGLLANADLQKVKFKQ